MQPVFPVFGATGDRPTRSSYRRRLDRGLQVLVQTNGQPSAWLQKYPTSCEPSRPALRGIRSRLGSCCSGSITQSSLPSGRRAPRDLFRALPDVDVLGAEPERPGHGRPLVVEGGARQVEVHLVRAAFCSWACWNWMLNLVSSLGSSGQASSSAISPSSTPAQKRDGAGRLHRSRREEATRSSRMSDLLNHARGRARPARP